jgi:hypothetical protein
VSATVVETISARGDWRRVHDLYQQFSRSVEDASGDAAGPPPAVTGALAEAMARVFASYQDQEETFLDDLATLFAEIDGIALDPIQRFRRLYKDTRLDGLERYRAGRDARRRPRPFEAAVETVRRIQDLNRIRNALERLPTSAVLGGSVSYGRFYNTCGAAGKASDIDLLLVVPQYEDLIAVPAQLRSLEFIDERQLQTMARRIDALFEVRKRFGRCVFQQKLSLWEDEDLPSYLKRFQFPGYYSLALHVMSLEDFQFVTLADIPRLDSLKRTIAEFRDDPPSGNANSLRCFAGYVRTFDQQAVEVTDGFVAHEIVGEILEDRFYPGMHLNLVLPQFEVRWESPDARIRLALLNLRWKLLARLTDERRLRTFEIQQLSLSHIRGNVLAPHVTRRVDRD